MKIQSYMTVNKISPEAMANRMGGGITESAVRKWVYGERVPRPDQLRRIAEVTNGEVMPNDFIIAAEIDAASEQAV